MRLALILVLLAATPWAAQATDAPASPAAETGQVVLGIGAAKGKIAYASYELLFRKAGDAHSKVRRFAYKRKDNVFNRRDPDYKSDDETGVVVVETLPQGEYEIFDFEIALAGVYTNVFSSRQPFSIRFEIRPGETVYLGNYQANEIRKKSIFGGTGGPAGAVFVIQDRQGQDLGLARDLQNPSTVRNATPDPRAIGSPFFVDAKPGS